MTTIRYMRCALIVMLCVVSRQVLQARQGTVERGGRSANVSIFVNGGYSGLDLSKVNDVYTTLAKNYNLPRGNDFKPYYSLLSGVRLAMDDVGALQGEVGGTLLKQNQNGSTNFLQMYYVGGSALLGESLDMLSVYGGGGIGYWWLNTQRTYDSRIGVARVNTQLGQIHGVVGISAGGMSGSTVGLEARYSFGTTLLPTRSDLDFNVKGISVALQFSAPILK